MASCRQTRTIPPSARAGTPSHLQHVHRIARLRPTRAEQGQGRFAEGSVLAPQGAPQEAPQIPQEAPQSSAGGSAGPEMRLRRVPRKALFGLRGGKIWYVKANFEFPKKLCFYTAKALHALPFFQTSFAKKYVLFFLFSGYAFLFLHLPSASGCS